MSLKTLLMPAISARLLSRERLLRLRQRAEASRRARGEPHQVHCFLQVDDPYSALLAQALPRFLARYHVRLVAHVVGPPLDSAVPERALLVAHSRRDAQLLATAWGLAFTDTGRQPAPQAIERATRQLVAAIDDGHFLDQAGPLLDALWRDAQAPGELGGQHLANAEATRSHLAAANALRQSLGHYLGGMLYCAGEWYWGIDRLHHLEQRLQDLGAQCEGAQGALFPTDAGALDHPTGPTGAAVPPVDFFFSLRSPYSAIVAPRVFALGQQAGAAVRLRYVLPMVMRGLAVPAEKRRYISQDAAREAHLQGTPFGRLNDPVGRPTERGLALIPLAERQGLGQAYVLSFMQGVWAEGIDAGSDRGLRRIAQRAGLPWADAQQALHDPAWRVTAEHNRQALLSLGLWGVPSFQVGSLAVWGQDRLWAVRDALLRQPTSSESA